MQSPLSPTRDATSDLRAELRDAATHLRRAAAHDALEGRGDLARILWRNATTLRRLAEALAA